MATRKSLHQSQDLRVITQVKVPLSHRTNQADAWRLHPQASYRPPAKATQERLCGSHHQRQNQVQQKRLLITTWNQSRNRASGICRGRRERGMASMAGGGHEKGQTETERRRSTSCSSAWTKNATLQEQDIQTKAFQEKTYTPLPSPPETRHGHD